ncbi:MAG TPA: TonB C-terminal domain-containing protein [Blastocatellia bacterium]|nr:TonB C-terminal domain-containing protein [Blastocatellia bacterium]
MRIHLILSAIMCTALASHCLAQSQDTTASKPATREMNVAPVKDLASELVQTCGSSGSDLASADSGVVVSFGVAQDGQIPMDSIKIVRSSGSKTVDTRTIEILWRAGQAHVLGPLSRLSAHTMSFRIHDGVTQLSLSSQAATAEEAKAKASQLSFLLKVIGQNQKTKNPIVSELLSNIVVTTNDERINTVISISCARAAEMLRMQSGGTTR